MADPKYITMEQLRDFAARADLRLDLLEANSPEGQELTLPANGWTKDSGDENYPYRCVLTVSGVTTASRVDAVLDESSIVVASSCGVCPTCTPVDGAVVFKSYLAPTAALTGVIYVTRVAAMND